MENKMSLAKVKEYKEALIKTIGKENASLGMACLARLGMLGILAVSDKKADVGSASINSCIYPAILPAFVLLGDVATQLYALKEEVASLKIRIAHLEGAENHE